MNEQPFTPALVRGAFSNGLKQAKGEKGLLATMSIRVARRVRGREMGQATKIWKGEI